MKKLFFLIIVSIILLNGCQKDEIFPNPSFTYKEVGSGEVEFFNSTINGNSSSFKWDFGTGDYSNERTPKYKFKQNKTYTVSLSVVGSNKLPYFEYITISTASNKGNVIIWTKIADEGVIYIKLSDIDVGTITKARGTGTVPSCGTDGFVTLERNQGTYTCEARSAKGTIWKRTLTIESGECKSIELTK
jgi:PKD repeat protein